MSGRRLVAWRAPHWPVRCAFFVCVAVVCRVLRNGNASPMGDGLGVPDVLVRPELVTRIEQRGVPAEFAEHVAVLSAIVGAEGAEPLCDPLTLFRFYLHCGDVQGAAAMHRNTARWRAEYRLGEAMAAYGTGESYGRDANRKGNPSTWQWRWHPTSPDARRAARHVFFERVAQTADDGGPLLVWRAGAADYSGIIREGLLEELIRAFVVHCEDVMQAGRAASIQAGALVRGRVVVDASGFVAKHLRHLAVLRRIVQLSSDHFPELLVTLTCVRAPTSVVSLFGLVQPWLKPTTANKVRIFAGDFGSEIRQHLGVDLTAFAASLGNASFETEHHTEAKKSLYSLRLAPPL